MKAAGLYLQLLALFILTYIHCEISCQTISEINTKQGVLKLMMGALRPLYCTILRSYSLVRRDAEAKRQNIGVSNAVQRNVKLMR